MSVMSPNPPPPGAALPPKQPMPARHATAFERLGTFVVRRRWAVIGAWILLLLVAVPFAPRAAGALRAGGFTLPDLPSAQARQVLESELGSAPSAVVVVLHSDGLEAGLPAFETAAAAAVRDVASAPHVRAVVDKAFSF